MSALSSDNWSWCTRRQRPKSTTDALCHQLADQSAISNGNPTKATAVACSNQSADTVRRFRKPLDGIHDRRFQTSNEKHVAPDRPTNPPYPDPLIQPSSIHLDPHDRLAGSQPSTSCVPKKKTRAIFKVSQLSDGIFASTASFAIPGTFHHRCSLISTTAANPIRLHIRTDPNQPDDVRLFIFSLFFSSSGQTDYSGFFTK